MSKIVLGADVPDLLVILHSGFTNKFAINFLVEPSDLVGVEAKLKFGDILHVAALTDTTYTWTFTAEHVNALTSLSSTVLILDNGEGPIKVASGPVEIRL